MNALEMIFWFSVLLILYAYAGYPLLLGLASAMKGRPVQNEATTPDITMIIPVHNQAGIIREKLDNCLALDYPAEKLHIVVSSDGSDDGTDEILDEYAKRGVTYISSPERQGKVAAQLRALPSIRGEVAVFTDASIMLASASLRAIVQPFADPEVGCVSSEDHVPGGGEGLYVRYEMLLRRLEGRVQTLIGVSGSFYAVRSSLVEPTNPRYTRDFLVPLTIIEKGYRIQSDPGAQGHFLPAQSPSSEFHRKVRTVMRGMDVLASRKRLLNPFQFPFVAWALLSHKVVRWLVPVALVTAFCSNAAILLTAPFYLFSFAAQLALYAGALSATLSSRASNFLPARASLFFLVTNGAILLAWIRYLAGNRAVVWEPTKR